jgi:uncharacterized protein
LQKRKGIAKTKIHPARECVTMLTPTQRRQQAIAITKNPKISGSARVVAEKIVGIMDEQFVRMAGYLGQPSPAGDYQQAEISGPGILALIKPVGDQCNLRCRYCFNKPFQASEVMPEAILEKIVKEVLETSPVGNFTLHGGEPTLAGLGFFQKLIDLQQRYARPGQEVKNSVVTNATLLNEDWAKFLSIHKFGVGISIDGPPEVHDKNRVYPDGCGSMERVLEGIRTLQAHGITPGVLSVVGCPPATSPQNLYDYFISIGIRQWRSKICRTKENDGGYGQYIEGLFETWCERGGNANIIFIEEVLRGLSGYRTRTCWMSGACQRLIGFEPDGVVSPCCEMSLDPQYHFGNIASSSLRDLLEGSAAKTFWAEKKKGDDNHCHGCEWGFLCKGGCTYQRIQYGGEVSGRDYLCDVYKDSFSRLAERIDSFLNQDFIQERDVFEESPVKCLLAGNL